MLDFKDHIHTTTIFKDSEGNEIREDRFGKKDEYAHSITFLNHGGGCTITGDYSTWSVGRTLIPHKGDKLYLDYFAEKIQNANYNQKISDFDTNEAIRQIQQIIDELDKDYLDDNFDEVKDWWENLKSQTEDEHTYIEASYNDYNKPDYIDVEQIPDGKLINCQIEIICEAYNEICRKIK